MTSILRFLALAVCVAAFSILPRPLAVAETADAVRAFSGVRAAFERIRTEYVDEVDDVAIFRYAVLGMVDVPNVDPRVLDGERVRRALTLGSTSRNAGVIIRALEGVYDEIRASARVQHQALVDAAIEGMIRGVDQHSEYMNPQRWRANQASVQNGSIGVEVTLRDGSIRVVNPIPNGPAQRAGIVAGDVVVAVDGVLVAGRGLEQVVAWFRGPFNSEVVLTVARAGKSVDVKIVRARVVLPSIDFHRYSDIGYVRIRLFNEQTLAAFKSALTTLQAGPDRLLGYVIDLRDNTGGLLEQAVGVTEALMAGGLIATTRGRTDRATQRFEARSSDLTNGMPLVLLINETTAAGAEIMAAALQEQDRTTLVGTQSYGAGTVQTIVPLGEHAGALRLTTSRIYTASGQPLEGNGLTPHVVVGQRTGSRPGAEGDDAQLVAALQTLRTRYRR